MNLRLSCWAQMYATFKAHKCANVRVFWNHACIRCEAVFHSKENIEHVVIHGV